MWLLHFGLQDREEAVVGDGEEAFFGGGPRRRCGAEEVAGVRRGQLAPAAGAAGVVLGGGWVVAELLLQQLGATGQVHGQSSSDARGERQRASTRAADDATLWPT